MSASIQAAVTSDLFGQHLNLSVWDLVTGSTLMTIKDGGISAARSVCSVRDEYIASAQKDTQIINLWSYCNQDKIKIVCPGVVTALACTSDGAYCIAGISNRVYVWQMCNGSLIAILERHYQPVTCIKVCNDKTYFVSGGEDGFVLVWFLPKILASSADWNELGEEKSREPKYVWSHHTAQVTDIHLGFGGQLARCVTCSTDQTAKVYELSSGNLLASISFECPMFAIAMDPAEFFLFVGGENGNIYETKLYEKPGDVTSQKAVLPTFSGHSGKVVCLSVSLDGLALLSGSNDNSVKVWHIITKQCMRTVVHKGPISNAFIIPTPAGLISKKSVQKSSLMPIKNIFVKNVNFGNDELDGFENGCMNVKINEKHRNSLQSNKSYDMSHLNSLAEVESTSNEQEIETLRQDIKRLRKINEQIYNYSVEEIFKASTGK